MLNFLLSCLFCLCFCSLFFVLQAIFFINIFSTQSLQRYRWAVVTLFAVEFLLVCIFPNTLLVWVWYITLSIMVLGCFVLCGQFIYQKFREGCADFWSWNRPSAIKFIQTGNTEKLKYLIDQKKIPLNTLYTWKTKYGKQVSRPLLQEAAKVGHVPTLKLLIENGANLEGTKLGAVKYLLEAGANIHTQTHKGSSTLKAASSSPRSSEIIYALVKAGAEVNRSDEEGNTALMWAIKCFEIDNVRALLISGADVHLHNKQGKTPLAISCECRQKALSMSYDKRENPYGLDPCLTMDLIINLLKGYGAK